MMMAMDGLMMLSLSVRVIQRQIRAYLPIVMEIKFVMELIYSQMTQLSGKTWMAMDLETIMVQNLLKIRALNSQVMTIQSRAIPCFGWQVSSCLFRQ